MGAIVPSSRYLAKKMIEGIDFENAGCIVEYGPGTGVFTDGLLLNRKPETLLVLFETDNAFFRLLKNKYGNIENLYVINDSAEHIGKYLAELHINRVDCVISGLPFASLPKNISESILSATKSYLKPGGLFITFQYTLFKKSLIARFFTKISITRELRNIPPAYVLRCENCPSGHKA